MSKTRTNEELLKILKDYSDNIGFPKQRDFKPGNGLPSAGVYIKRFGTWNKAKELAGIKDAYVRVKEDKYKPEEIIIKFKKLCSSIGKIANTQDIRDSSNMPTLYVINKHFKGIDGLIDACGFESNYKNGKYKPKFLIDEVKRFAKEFGRTPTATDFDNLEGYPSRKTFSNHFTNFDEAIMLAGFEVVGRGSFTLNTYPEVYNNREFLINEVYRFTNEFGYIPTIKEMTEKEGYPTRSHYRKVFGTWNNALEECGLELNSIAQYEDSFLESEFHRFVIENKRVPTIKDFNKSEYPSFWCYQQRFGSWIDAIRSYGYEIPNTYGFKYTFDDGETVLSKYEHEFSLYLKQNGFIYNRDYFTEVYYKDFINNYNRLHRIDYIVQLNNRKIYIEIAGFLRDYKDNYYNDIVIKKSYRSEQYRLNLMKKEQMLKESNLEYYIIFPQDYNEEFFNSILK